MNRILLATVAVLALTGAANAATPPGCSATNTIAALQPILQQNIVDVVNLAPAYVDDPFTLNMKESLIVTLDEAPHKNNCKIAMSLTNKADPDKKINEKIDPDSWITYSVEITDNDTILINAYWSATMNDNLEMIKAGAALKQLQASVTPEEKQTFANMLKVAIDEADNNRYFPKPKGTGKVTVKLIVKGPYSVIPALISSSGNQELDEYALSIGQRLGARVPNSPKGVPITIPVSFVFDGISVETAPLAN
jgi:hypothetical protein